MTGATGFVGGYVLQAALDAGHTVKAMVRRPTAVSHIKHDNLEWIIGGLGEADQNLVQGCDAIIHMAGLIKARKTEDYYAVNAEAAGVLAQAAKNAGVARFLLISSMAASMPELSDYAGSKHAGEAAVKTHYSEGLTIIRAPAVFGPGDEATKPFFDLLQKGLLPVPGGFDWKDRQISMVYVPDLASEIIRAVETGCYEGDITSPATMPRLTWQEFGALCRTAFDRNIKVIPLPLTLLYPVAGVTSLTSRIFGLGHLTLGKLAEFLHADWSSETLISGATQPIEALKITLAAYQSHKE